MAAFKDNFSKQSDIYVKYRPVYPDALYEFLAELTPGHELAWDCGTGNGQAAIGLAAHYKRVIATEPSEQQLANAIPHERVQYIAEPAEHSSLASHSADLVTVANALHWFHFDEFYAEVRRVLKPGGIIAAWSYPTPIVSPEVDEVISHYHDVLLNGYWRYENELVNLGYTTLPFPFAEIESPAYTMNKEMSIDDVIGYISTWSGTQRYISENQTNPTHAVRARLLAVWGKPGTTKTVTWKLALKTGRV